MIDYIKKGTNSYWRAILSLFLGSFSAFGVECCVQPIIPILAAAFDLSPAQSGLTMSFTTIGMAISMLCIAGLSKKLNRRKTMAIALFISSCLTIVIAISENFHFILLLRILQGFLLAGYPALALAYINEEFEPNIIGRVVGFYVAGITIGGLAGRLAISILTDYISWRTGIACVGVLYVLISILFYVFLPTSKNSPQSENTQLHILKDIRSAIADKKLLSIYCIAFLIFGAFTCIYNYITYILMAAPYQLSQTAIGFIFMMYVFGTIGSTFFGRLIDRYGNDRILCFSLLLMIFGVTLTLAPELLFKIVGLAIITFSFFGSHCVACSWTGRIAATNLKAQVSSMYMFFYYCGGSALGAIGGLFLKDYGWTGIVFMVILLLVIATALCLQLTFSQYTIHNTASYETLPKIKPIALRKG